MLASTQTLSWWIWGIVATLTTVIMLFSSMLFVRRWSYEFFLISHIVLAVLTIVGCWYHIMDLFKLMGDYQHWLYISIGVWTFDRLVRVLRILKAGVRHANVVDLGVDSEYVRIDVKGIRWGAEPGKHVYVYFPTLNPLRPWENHPFSLVPTSMLHSSRPRLTESSVQDDSSGHACPEKQVTQVQSSNSSKNIAVNTTAGISFFVRKNTGLTKLLQNHNSLLTLLDGPYSNNAIKPILRCDRVVLMTGVIGISGVLPWAHAHPNVKLYWSMKQSAECLSQATEVALSELPEKDIRFGQRLDIRNILAQEVENGWDRIGVVACGPGGLCDDVRAAVVELGRKGAKLELEVDAYSW